MARLQEVGHELEKRTQRNNDRRGEDKTRRRAALLKKKKKAARLQNHQVVAKHLIDQLTKTCAALEGSYMKEAQLVIEWEERLRLQKPLRKLKARFKKLHAWVAELGKGIGRKPNEKIHELSYNDYK